ncbi:prepilin-type N-terminal cleavage/methylation domain-containing protein, partial [bacterium]|nr:prepilin-type N-terminal cleavage/methylation domain-containing protein [bacterium]
MRKRKLKFLRKGFTFLELMVVVAILAILASLIIP